MENEVQQPTIDNNTNKMIMFCENLMSYNRKLMRELTNLKQNGMDLEIEFNELKETIFFPSQNHSYKTNSSKVNELDHGSRNNMIIDESNDIPSSSSNNFITPISSQINPVTEPIHTPSNLLSNYSPIRSLMEQIKEPKCTSSTLPSNSSPIRSLMEIMKEPIHTSSNSTNYNTPISPQKNPTIEPIKSDNSNVYFTNDIDEPYYGVVKYFSKSSGIIKQETAETSTPCQKDRVCKKSVQISKKNKRLAFDSHVDKKEISKRIDAFVSENITKENRGLKPYICNLCNYRGKTLNSIKAHSSVHSDASSYSCVDCGARYKYKSSLKKHTKKNHSNEK